MKKNIIFLDVDGVLNSSMWFKKIKSLGFTRVTHDLDPDACKLVKDLAIDYNCGIVISSSWRCSRLGMKMLNEAFGNLIIGCTEDDKFTYDRAKEIHDWLDTNKGTYNKFVIIDDEDFAAYDGDSFIKTNDGISINNINTAKAYFDSDKYFNEENGKAVEEFYSWEMK